MPENFPLIVTITVVITATGLSAVILVGLQRLNQSGKHGKLPNQLSILMIVWLLVSFVLSLTGFYDQAIGPLPTFVIALILPVIAWFVIIRRSTAFRAIVLDVSPTTYINIQSFRMVGFVFLILLGNNLLPTVMARPAGIGDFLTGLLAPLVAYLYIQNAERFRGLVLAWATFGILDLVNALALGYLNNPNAPVDLFNATPKTEVMSLFPMVLIPAFLVPLAYIFHFALIYSLQQNKSRAEHRELGAKAGY
ncbi:MAG: hypothetical protein AAF614_33255 [Chloroflexota bacterium]